jgi:hypothetical protein
VAVYKTTPQGDLKINPPKWNPSDRRPAIVFLFARSCATGSPAQFVPTAEYFAVRGLVATAPTALKVSITRSGALRRGWQERHPVGSERMRDILESARPE